MAEIGQLVRIIPWTEITKGKKLGEGGFGIVYRGTWKHHREEVAIKEIKGELGEDAAEELRREAEITKRLDSPYIIKLWGLCWEHQKYAMVMELMPKASLYNLLHNGQELSWNVRYSIAQDIAYGLRFLHENKILHRDLKSLNVLLDDRLRARLSDFGLAKLKHQSRSTSTVSGKSVGTTAWKAPEIFGLNPKYSTASDVYAYGITSWELAARAVPYQGVDAETIQIEIKKGERAEIPEDCPPTFASLIQSCWAQDLKSRPNIDKVVATLGEIIKAEGAAPEPAAPAAPKYQDASLDSLGVVTNAPAEH